MAKIILTHEVSGLGEPGDVVEVKDGYARNYLIPRKLATPWTRGGQSQVSAIRKARKAREVATQEQAKATAERLAEAPIVVSAKAGPGGRLFGAITPSDIADAIAAAGHQVDKRKIEIAQPIKTTGESQVSIRLHPEVVAPVVIKVLPA